MAARFGTLDALRGLAASSVVVFHAKELVRPLSAPHAYLAVDLFFVLSGFVIAHAYESRLPGLGWGKFFALRLVRLYPLYLAGLLIGLGYAILQRHGGSDYALSVQAIVWSLGLGLLFLPSPVTGVDPNLYPLNFPAWSLLFELGVNLVYALTYRWWTSRLMACVLALSACGIVLAGLYLGDFDRGAHWPDIWVGLLRVTFSFPMGVLIYRARLRFACPSLTPVVLCVLTLGVMLFPARSVAFDIVAILVLGPVLVLLGSNCAVSGRSARLFAFAGAASYALYALHAPILALARGFAARALHAELDWRFGLPTIAACVAFSWALDRYYDAPVRRWLTSGGASRSRSSTSHQPRQPPEASAGAELDEAVGLRLERLTPSKRGE